MQRQTADICTTCIIYTNMCFYFHIQILSCAALCVYMYRTKYHLRRTNQIKTLCYEFMCEAYSDYIYFLVCVINVVTFS